MKKKPASVSSRRQRRVAEDGETGRAAARRNGKRGSGTRRSVPLPGMGTNAEGPDAFEAEPNSETGRAEKVREVVVPIWQGPVDWRAVDPRLLALVRHYDARSPLTQAELARRSDMDRRLLHKFHEKMKVCTVAMLCRWCNGRRMDAAYFLFVVLESLRQEAAARPAGNGPKSVASSGVARGR